MKGATRASTGDPENSLLHIGYNISEKANHRREIELCPVFVFAERAAWMKPDDARRQIVPIVLRDVDAASLAKIAGHQAGPGFRNAFAPNPERAKPRRVFLFAALAGLVVFRLRDNWRSGSIRPIDEKAPAAQFGQHVARIATREAFDKQPLVAVANRQ